MGFKNTFSTLLIIALLNACDGKNTTSTSINHTPPAPEQTIDVNGLREKKNKQEKKDDKTVLSFDVIHYVYDEGELIDRCVTEPEGLIVDLETLSEEGELILCDSETVVFKITFDGEFIDLVVYDKGLGLSENEIIQQYHGNRKANVTSRGLGVTRFDFSQIKGSAHIHVIQTRESALDEFIDKYLDLKMDYLDIAKRRVLEMENMLISDPHLLKEIEEVHEKVYKTLSRLD